MLGKETETAEEQVERLEAQNRMLLSVISDLSRFGDYSTKAICKRILSMIKEGAD
jgi:hypothetical protein